MPWSLVGQMERGTCRLGPEALDRLADALEFDSDALRELAEMDGYFFDPDSEAD